MMGVGEECAIDVLFGVGLPVDAAYDLGERCSWLSDSCRKMLAGRDVGSDEGISGGGRKTAAR